MLRSKFIPATMAAGRARECRRNSRRSGGEGVARAGDHYCRTQQTGGRAVKIDVEGKNGTHLYEIKTISGENLVAAESAPAPRAITLSTNTAAPRARS
jgi:hypothetical protein